MTTDRETKIAAPISGTVAEVLVKVGDEVREGTELLIIESMKMEIPVESPGSGTLVRVVVSPGDPVNEGDLLAVIA